MCCFRVLSIFRVLTIIILVVWETVYASMASSSSSPSSSSVVPTRGCTFLAFRSDEPFIRHLCEDLVQKGVTPYPVCPDLLEVIEESKTAVVIFCRSNAENYWCSDELAKIIKCQERMGQKVLPELYYLDLSHEVPTYDLESVNEIDMDDRIQAMGWQEVCKISPNTRLWKLEEVDDFIENRELEEIEAIVVPNNQATNVYQKLDFGAHIFESMKNLRLIDVCRKFTSREPTSLPPGLQWLSWNQYPFSSLPLADKCELVGLKMLGGNIDHLWNGRKIMLNLKFIHLRRLKCLTKVPDMSGVPNLEKLVLESCSNLMEVHESIGSLKMLAYLSLSKCRKLKFFLSRIGMESLETLILSGCSSLEEIPDFTLCVRRLSIICLDGCLRIEKLPSSIICLSSLSFLKLTGCKRLKNLPNGMSMLNCLERIHLDDCPELLTLPEDFGSIEIAELKFGFTDSKSTSQSPTKSHTLQNLRSLRMLDLSWRQTIDLGLSGPINSGAFYSLVELNISGNSDMTELPALICHLSHLKHLELNECHKLQILLSLPSGIQVLKASDCSSLEMIEDLPEKYKWLYKIWLIGCWNLLDQEDGTNLCKMLQRSFLEKCAVVGHRLSIAIPGYEIPSWFVANQDGCDITLNLPSGWHSHIMGFAVSAVFNRMWNIRDDYPVVKFTMLDDGVSIPMTECDDSDDSDDGSRYEDTVWIGYIPVSYFQQMRDDWSGMEVNVAISVKLQTGQLPVRCGVHIVNNDDVESIQPNTNNISDYCNSECVTRIRNCYTYEDELRNIWQSEEAMHN